VTQAGADKTSNGLGLFRDFAAIGLVLIFGWLDERQAGGVVLLLSTGAAFGAWAYAARKRSATGG